MSSLRRSVRRRNPVKIFSDEASAQVTISERKTRLPSSSVEAEEICIGCKETRSSVGPKATNNLWIECHSCSGWWHINCAKISKGDSVKVHAHNIEYSCALCVLKCIGIQSEPSPSAFGQKIDRLLEVTSIIADQTSIAQSKTINPKAHPTLVKNQCKSNDHIVVVDGIENPKQFKDSHIIKQHLAANPKTSSITIAHSLVHGGVALHTESADSAEDLIKHWPKGLLGSEALPHKPAKKGNKSQNLYLRNIPIKVKTEDLAKSLTKEEIKFEKVHRLIYKDTGKPMPIVRITLCNSESTDRLIQSDGLLIPGTQKRARFCPERNFKAVRCFKCHKFGHIANSCTSDSCCQNCGDKSCTTKSCSKPAQCINCELPHKASSSQCPVFIQQQSRRRVLALHLQ